MDRSSSLNLFFLGTGHHRETSNNILTQFYNAAKKSSGDITDPLSSTQFTHLFDGPGCKGTEKDPTPGQYTYDPSTGEKISRHDTSLGFKFFQIIQKITGLFAGDGVEDNMIEALQVIKHLEAKGQLPTTINMFGHSRGADTTLRLANILRLTHPEIKINIFAIDPVAGFGRASHKQAVTVPQNVDEYVSILSVDENRPHFEAQDKSKLNIEAPERTKAHFHMRPGEHNIALRFKGDKTQGVAKLCWDDMYHFAGRHGLNLTTMPQYVDTSEESKPSYSPAEKLTDPERFKLFYEIKTNIWFYQKQRQLKVEERDFLAHKDDYCLESNYFLSQDHRELFKKLYPNLFDYLFQKGIEKKSIKDVRHDAEKLLHDHPDIFATLKEKGLGAIEDKITLPVKPQGVYYLESSSISRQQPVAHNQLSFLEYAVKNTIDNFLLKGSSDPKVELIAKKLRDNIDVIKKSDLDDERKIKEIKTQALKVAIFLSGYSLEASVLDFSNSLGMCVYDLTTHVKLINRVLSRAPEENANPDIVQLITLLRAEIQSITNTKDKIELEKIRDINQKVIGFLNDISNLLRGNKELTTQYLPLYIDLISFLVESRHGESFADQAIGRMNEYLWRNKIYKFLDTISFGKIFNRESLETKEKLAIEVKDKLIDLKMSGDGYDKDKVNKILVDALKDSEEKKLPKDAFENKIKDQLLESATLAPARSFGMGG